MSSSGFKFVVPLLACFGEHCSGLVCSPLRAVGMEVKLIPKVEQGDDFVFKSGIKQSREIIKDLVVFSDWAKQQLGFSNISFRFQFIPGYGAGTTAYFSVVMYSLFHFSRSDDKPDYADFVKNGYTFLRENNFEINRLQYFTFLLGGTRFDIGEEVLPVRQSFPNGCSLIFLDGIPQEFENSIIELKVDERKLLSLYHGLFFSDWEFIRWGLQSVSRLELAKDIDDFLISVDSCYIKDKSDGIYFIFPNSLLSSDFLEILDNFEIADKGNIKPIESSFIDDGITLC